MTYVVKYFAKCVYEDSTAVIDCEECIYKYRCCLRGTKKSTYHLVQEKEKR